MNKDTVRTGVPAIAVLLAACSGSCDVFAFFGLGKTFASIVTGNLVSAGYGVATGNAALLKPNLIAVAGYVIGGIAWARLVRLPRPAIPLLVGELIILLGVLTAWLVVGEAPAAVLKLVLLAALSVAMGGQSIWALRIHQTTTYFTGILTMAISAASEGSTGLLRTGIRQFAALLAGAIVSGVALSQLRAAAPAVPVAFLAAAIAVQVFASPNPAGRDEAGAK